MEKETNKSKIIFITALVCIALCIPIGVILGRTLLGKNESNKTNNNVVNKQNNLTNKIDNVIDNTSNIINNTINNTQNIDSDDLYEVENFDEKTKQIYNLFNRYIYSSGASGLDNSAIDVMTYEKKVITYDDIKEHDKINIIKGGIGKEDRIDTGTNSEGYETFEISANVITNLSYEFFGKYISLPKYFFLFPASCKLSNNKYICSSGPTGALASPCWKYIPISYEETEDLLKITGIAAYWSVTKFYTNLDNVDITNGYCENISYEKENNCLRNYANDFQKMTLTLKLNGDNHYVFDKIELN